ncbi:MAG: SMI1/KNR4 family protein [Actinomycetales bacterium]|nr:SMI1/KNR4 family protein [Actinomycetales bacterium]
MADTLGGWRQGTLDPGLLAFADNGTGNPSCVPVDGHDEVILWGWIDGEPQGSEVTLSDFLARWAPLR